MSAGRGRTDDHYSPIEATRRGAHRARPGAFSGVAPVVAVAVVVLVVVLGLWTVVGKLGGGGSEGTASGPTASASPSADQNQTQPPETQPAESPETEPPAEVDRSASIRVLNNTATAGLARRAAGKLEGGGWKVGEVGDHKPRGSVASTTVFYADPSQQATAQAVADEVGAKVEESADIAANGITLVLAGDYQA